MAKKKKRRTPPRDPRTGRFLKGGRRRVKKKGKKKAKRRPAQKKKAKKKVRRRKKNPQLMIVTNPKKLPKRAMDAYRNFHGTKPMQVTRVNVPAGTPKHLIELGKARTIEYRPTNRSWLADKRARETIMKHRFSKDAMVVTDPAGKFIGVVNPTGKTRVSGLKKGQRKVGIVG